MNLAIIGGGAMGTATQRQAIKHKRIDKIWLIDPLKEENLEYLDEIGEKVDGIIDFSHPDNLKMLYEYLQSKEGKIPLVIGTTGYDEMQREKLLEIAKIAPLMESSNYSYGVNILKRIAGGLAGLLNGKADISIVEKHHSKKRDAPSGTALTLAKSMKLEPENISSVRGGTIPGTHEILFAMEDETIELTHRAYSKTIFANGAIEAVLWLQGKEAGLYNVEDMLYN